MVPQIPAIAFPATRLRRLRRHAALRGLVRETWLSPEKLVLPLFIRRGRKIRRPIPSMPGISQLSPDEAIRLGEAALDAGVRAVLLFGIPDSKDAQARGAWQKAGVIQTAVAQLKRALPELLVMTDVCLCEYTSHGHCGLLAQKDERGEVMNDQTLALLARTAVSHAEAGADVVAPSDMMDGRIGAIRSALDRAGFADLPVMSYAAKLASAYYGPFREAAGSAPRWGDRRTYQMDPANAREALREVALDISEGADIILVKPALAALDIVFRVSSTFGWPTAAYHVSGEYVMWKAAADRGWIDREGTLLESLMAIRRAGADFLITYAAMEGARLLRRG